MGYWSQHPMGGDLPLDVEYELWNLLFTKKEQEEGLQYEEELYQKRLEQRLEEAVSLRYSRGGYGNYPFVLPFKMAELEVRTSNKELSEKIKGMIGDGGAMERGYDIPKEGSKKFPTKENYWNGLQSPFDYARQLYDVWDELMNGTLSFTFLKHDKGLFAAIEKKIGENDGDSPGLINVK